MAYAAVVSLKNTIHHLLNSSHISISPPSTIESAYKEVQSLQEFIERVNAFDGQIREASYKLEDVIESHTSNQFLSQLLSPDQSRPSFTLDLQEVNQNVDSFCHTVKKLKEDYYANDQLRDPLMLHEQDDVVPSRTDFGGKMVGFGDEFRGIKNHILQEWQCTIDIVSLIGMAGIGKTTLAKKIFEDPSIVEYFDIRVWVNVGQKLQLKEIMQGILAQVLVNPNFDKNYILKEGDTSLAKYLHTSLKGRRYLIVLDDVWNGEAWHGLKRLLPEDTNGSRFLLTTRVKDAALYYTKYPMRFLNKEESWDLLRERVFGEELCSPQLEKVGKKIAEKCEGLPLTIVTVADLLSQAEKTLEYWNMVAEEKNSIFMDAYDHITKVLHPSYNYLPQHLKACFLYMGVFPQKNEIPTSKLIMLWSTEGFLEPHLVKRSSLEEFLEVFDSNSLLVTDPTISSYEIKTSRLHSSFWHLCKREAEKNKFFHVINSYVDGIAKRIKSHRRLCIHNNVLFNIKDVYNSVSSISTARSLLCTGPPHQYPIPIFFVRLRLLRILDALTVRFYEFPIEVLTLVQLKYLALTFNGHLHSSISKLWNLQFLIVSRYMSIKSFGAQSFLPMEIWDMKELKHLQVMGSDLPDPCGGRLPNLLTLSGVSTHSCTKGVLEGLPNLKKLGIQIELVPSALKPFICFDLISRCDKLKSLKCIIVNPTLSLEVVARPPRLTIFQSYLRKLCLTGFGYPWEDMRVIGSLPKLEVLKLQCYAFQGPKWEVRRNMFKRLEILMIEDTDLVHWTIGPKCFPLLKCLSLKNCYKLEEIPLELGESLGILEVVDCNPLAVTCAKQIEEDRSKKSEFVTLETYLYVNINSSWNDADLIKS